MNRLSLFVWPVIAALGIALPPTQGTAQVKLDMAVFHSESDSFAGPLKWWIAEVERRTGGKVRIVPHYSGSLSKVTELPDALRNGVVPMGVTAPPFHSGTIPALAYLEVIGGLPSTVEANRQLLPELASHVNKLLAQQNVVMLWAVPTVGVALACRNKHLRSPDDWKGVKIRTAGRWQAEQFKALGATPVRIDPAEQYLAIQNGTIDCAAGFPALVLAAKLHEVGRKITASKLSASMTMYLINRSAWTKLGQAERDVMEEAGRLAQDKAVVDIAAAQTEALRRMKAAGAEIVELTDAETEAFRAASKTIYSLIDQAAGEAGAPIRALILPAR